jgi:hypothetical protein
MYTSCFGNVKNIPAELEPVAIARGTPRAYRGRRFKALAPTWAMLTLPREEYDRQFDAILDSLEAQQVYEELGENAVLLCWEAPGFWCHRRRVAEWFEERLGVSVPECGIAREDSLPYVEMPEAPKKK